MLPQLRSDRLSSDYKGSAGRLRGRRRSRRLGRHIRPLRAQWSGLYSADCQLRVMRATGAIPVVTVAQMREVDRLMIEEIGVELPQMMENAGRALATHARALLGGDARGHRVIVLAGRGGNGGGGLAAARRLAIWGADVSVSLAQRRGDMRGVPAQQLAAVERLGVVVWEPADFVASRLRQVDLVLDAIIGYSLSGAPRDAAAQLIWSANDSGVPCLALDLPSGLDGDTGLASDPTIRAVATLTLALPKVGLVEPSARAWVGDLCVADISVPEVVFERIGLHVGPIFARADIISVPWAQG